MYKVFCLFLMFSSFAIADEPLKTNVSPDKEEAIETLHDMTINGQKISYKAIAGTLLTKDEKGSPTASIFYVSYTKEGNGNGNGQSRPVTFCFNGGPGSSSVWLHMGLLGPKRVYLSENEDSLPPYQLIDNEYSLLDQTDLVFIDAVSTGYSRSIPPDEAKRFYGVEEDIKLFAEIIRLYITKYNRWESPKFIVGESYGTTRAAGLAGYLHDTDYIYINGIVLISSILNFESIDFTDGNDLPYLLFLPSYTATAWYHKKLSPELQVDFDSTIKKARDFVLNDYVKALFKGALITPQEKANLVKQLAAFTGLDPGYIEKSNLRIDVSRYMKELLRDKKRTIGRFDSRYLGIDADAVGEHTEYDPSLSAVIGTFTAGFDYYARSDLKWTSREHYKVLGPLSWNYGPTNQYLNVAQNLRSVMTKSPYMTVFVASGYYDLATPFFGTEYTFNHLGLDPSLLNHVTMKYYPAGHMMYIDPSSLKQLKGDLDQYYQKTMQEQGKKLQNYKKTTTGDLHE